MSLSSSGVLEKAVTEMAHGAGDILIKYFTRKHRIKVKPGEGIVTEADPLAEKFILEKIFKKFPKSSVITEETGEYPGTGELLWVIDPLDGTSNYAHGFPWFSVSIAVYQGTEPIVGAVYHPLMKELFLGTTGKGAYLNGKRLRVTPCAKLSNALLGTGFYYSKGVPLQREMRIFGRMNQLAHAVRRPGSAALDLASVAAGRFDGFWERGLSSWDVAAGMILVTEAGGMVSNYKGKRTDIFEKEMLASNGKIHKELVGVIRRNDKG